MRLLFRVLGVGVCCAALAACSSTPDISMPVPPPPGEPGGLVGLSAAKLRVAYRRAGLRPQGRR